MIGLQPESASPSTPEKPAAKAKIPSRAEYLDMAKRRAMDLIRDGEYAVAYARFCFELTEHPELGGELATLGRIMDGLKLQRNGQLATQQKMTNWIHSFT